MSYVVELTDAEVTLAERVGEARQAYVDAHGLNQPIHTLYADDPAEQHRQGAAGELAVAKCLDVPWTPYIGPGDKGEADVGDWHVRATEYPTGHLLLQQGRPGLHDDESHHRFLLVVGARADRKLTLVGWCYGWEGKRPENWRETCRHPCYWVRQDQLRPVRAEVVALRKAA